MEFIIKTIENGICTLTINRPDQYNALNRDVLIELDSKLDLIVEEADSRVFTLVQKSNDALSEMSKALDIMTKSNEHLADSISRLIERK